MLISLRKNYYDKCQFNIIIFPAEMFSGCLFRTGWLNQLLLQIAYYCSASKQFSVDWHVRYMNIWIYFFSIHNNIVSSTVYFFNVDLSSCSKLFHVSNLIFSFQITMPYLFLEIPSFTFMSSCTCICYYLNICN